MKTAFYYLLGVHETGCLFESWLKGKYHHLRVPCSWLDFRKLVTLPTTGAYLVKEAGKNLTVKRLFFVLLRSYGLHYDYSA